MNYKTRFELLAVKHAGDITSYLEIGQSVLFCDATREALMIIV